MVYQEVNIQNDREPTDNTPPGMITVSVDEKPGIQAIATVAPDLLPKPGRYKSVGRDYVHTPKHGSWLNLVEMAFSKMARSFLRHIRVSSKDELKERILPFRPFIKYRL